MISILSRSALISAYGRSGYCDEVIKVFETLKSSGLKPNLVAYNAVIDACGKWV
ncbi:hypothetical protein VitviT2T_024875 [Vitis vinifera]|uniref:Pentatricopeptide repeat-containing protein n=1 Tax=Vitis vinifera TaxID=29760 RepID=A0ABY9DJZ6_VITVI|nr:hypothetical protein VitviT2T_024875 [Vitis vinifera]